MFQQQNYMLLKKFTYQMHPDTRKMLNDRHADLTQMISRANPTVSGIHKKLIHDIGVRT
jgi:hypothetical protein